MNKKRPFFVLYAQNGKNTLLGTKKKLLGTKINMVMETILLKKYKNKRNV